MPETEAEAGGLGAVDTVTGTDVLASPRAPRHRRAPLLGVAAAALVAVVAGGVSLATRGGGDGGPEQTLCDLPRKAGTPLDVLLPKDRPGAEERGDADEPGRRTSCLVTVDGEEAVRFIAIVMDADEPTTGSGGTSRTRADLAGRGVVANATGGSTMDFCPSDRTRVIGATVLLNPDLLPGPDDDLPRYEAAIRSLTATVLADQKPKLCG